MKKFIMMAAALSLLLSLAGPAPARCAEKTPEESVSDLLQQKIDKVLSILEDSELSEEKRKKEVMAVIEPVIDFPLMAKLTLGKNNWNRLSQNQQDEFVDRFVERLKASYLDKTALYSDQEVSYGKAEEKGGKVHVPMEIETGDEAAQVLYKFYPKGSEWRVYDVAINGVSLIQSYRSQFNEILRHGTVEDLLHELGKPADEELGKQQ